MESLQPHNQEAEEAVVGSLFLDNELVKECTLKQEHFYSWKLRKVFDSIRRLDEKGIPIDMVSILEEMGVDNVMSLGGFSYIEQLAGSVPTTANFSFYEKMVKESYQKRKAIEVAGKIIADAKGKEISNTLSNGISNLMAIEAEQTDEDHGDLLSSLTDLFEDCEKDLGDIVGIASGFTTLDKLTGGLLLGRDRV